MIIELLSNTFLFSGIDNYVLLKLRDELWTEVLWLISELLGIHSPDDSCGEENGHSVFHSLLIRSRGEPLASVFSVALSGSLLTDLQRAALACTQSLLCHPACKIGQPFAVLLDDINADFNSSNVAVKEVELIIITYQLFTIFFMQCTQCRNVLYFPLILDQH